MLPLTGFFLLVAILSVEGAMKVDTVVIKNNGSTNTCPSKDERETAKLQVSNAVKNLLQNVTILPECGKGFWYFVASMNMSDQNQTCPSDWIEYSNPVRSCASPPARSINCEGGVSYPVPTSYSRVCGRAIGHGLNTPDAFEDSNNDIDGSYVDGISVTYGSPRQHIWTFAAGHGPVFNGYRCPCDNQDRSQAPLPPSFVGNNYYCDGDYNGALWDGTGCTTECCRFNSPPWFSVSLSSPTSDSIEIRTCHNQHANDERVHVSFFEFYVQ